MNNNDDTMNVSQMFVTIYTEIPGGWSASEVEEKSRQRRYSLV